VSHESRVEGGGVALRGPCRPCYPRLMNNILRGGWWSILAAALVLAIGASGCRRDGSPATSAPGDEASGPAGSVVPPEVLRTVCAADCSGPFAQVFVYRDAAGAIGRYELQGDLDVCSSPPTFFFDPAGLQTGAIPLVPVVPGSEEAQGYDAIRAEQTAGLGKAETILCRDAR
jgi:hypothetical protein